MNWPVVLLFIVVVELFFVVKQAENFLGAGFGVPGVEVYDGFDGDPPAEDLDLHLGIVYLWHAATLFVHHGDGTGDCSLLHWGIGV